MHTVSTLVVKHIHTWWYRYNKAMWTSFFLWLQNKWHTVFLVSPLHCEGLIGECSAWAISNIQSINLIILTWMILVWTLPCLLLAVAGSAYNQMHLIDYIIVQFIQHGNSAFWGLRRATKEHFANICPEFS